MAYKDRLTMLANSGEASASGAKNIDEKPKDNNSTKVI